jgi:isopropylmalate/homocitrate/citramalate synthase
VTLEAHLHNDFGLAVANSIAAVTAGCDVVHATVAGLGERAGNCALEEAALALELLYDIGHGLRSENFFGLARLVAERAGTVIPGNKPVVGERLFEMESGIVAGWWDSCGTEWPLEVFPYRWDHVGQPTPRVVFGKGSGLPSLAAIPAIDAGIPEAVLREILSQLKQRALSTKALVPAEEVASIARSVVGAAEA